MSNMLKVERTGDLETLLFKMIATWLSPREQEGHDAVLQSSHGGFLSRDIYRVDGTPGGALSAAVAFRLSPAMEESLCKVLAFRATPRWDTALSGSNGGFADEG